MSVPARGGLLDLLVPDARDRRAIDETLADWREERSRQTGAGRPMVDARGVLACARVFAASAVVPFGRVELWRYFGWTLVVAVGIGAIMAMQWPLQTSIPVPTWLWLTLLPQSVIFTIGLAAAFGLGLRRGQKLPVLAALTSGGVIVLLLAGWVGPESNQYFRETVAITVNPGVAPPPRGLAEQSLPALLSDVWSADPRAQIRGSRGLAMKAGLVMQWLALIALGEAIRRRLSGRLPWKLVQALSGCGALAVAFGTIFAVVPLLVTLPASWGLYLPEYQVNWFAATAATWLAAWWLVRRTRTRTSAPRNLRHPGT